MSKVFGFSSTHSLLCSAFSSLSSPELPFSLIAFPSTSPVCSPLRRSLLFPTSGPLLVEILEGGLVFHFSFVLFLCCRDRLSLCIPGCLRMFCAEQAGLELREIHVSSLSPIKIKSMCHHAWLNFCLHPFTHLNFSTPDSNQMTISDHEIVKMSR